MRRERHEKSVHIPVRVRNGKVEFVFDSQFPRLKDDAAGHIVMDADAIDDPKWRAFLTSEKEVLLAPAQSTIALRVAQDKGAGNLKNHLLTVGRACELAEVEIPSGQKSDELYGPLFPPPPAYWIEAQLREPLVLRLRSCKSAQLRGGRPFVQALADCKEEPQMASLNQALTRVSRVFEPKRQGNTGDAFRDVLLLQNGVWTLLENIRARKELSWENDLSQEFGLEPDKLQRWRFGGLFAFSVEEEI